MDALIFSSEATAGTSGGQYLSEVTLASGSNAISSPATPAPGDILAMFLTQPSGGGGTLSWASIFKNVTADDNDSRANKVNSYLFVGRSDGNWWLTSMILGRP